MKLISLLLVLTFCVACTSNGDVTEGIVLQRMLEYSKRGRHDDAIRIGREWLEQYPDGEQVRVIVALLLVAKAEKVDGDAIKDLVDQATHHANLAAESATDFPSIQRSAAMVFEHAARLVPAQRCLYYERAGRLREEATKQVALRSSRPGSELTPGEWSDIRKEYESEHAETLEKAKAADCDSDDKQRSSAP